MPAALSERDLDSTFAALADGTRRAIVARLAMGDASVMELGRPFDMSQPAISKHLKVLERAGLITRRREAQRRPCRLEPRRLKQIADWVGSYRQFWEESFGRLDDYLQELQAAQRQTPKTTAKATANSTASEKTHDVKIPRNHRRSR
jgi:DNA-binding transcriptional ArsR family regulator